MFADLDAQDRRNFLIGAGAALGLAAPGAAAAAPLEVANTLANFLRLTLIDAEARIYWWAIGDGYISDGVSPPVPLARSMTLGIYDIKPAEGAADVRMREVGFLADLETGRPVTRLVNPLNGSAMKVSEGFQSEQTYRLRPLAGGVSRTVSGSTSGPEAIDLRFTLSADDALLLSHTPAGAGIAALAGTPVRDRDGRTLRTAFDSFSASRKLFEDQAVTFVDAQDAYAIAMPAASDFALGKTGVTLIRGLGKKALPGSDLHPQFAEWIRVHYPNLL